MSTSGSYDNTSTMATIIGDAFSAIGVHDPGEPLPAEMWAVGKRVLNQLMSVVSKHRGLWQIEDVDVDLNPGVKSYTIGEGLDIDFPRPMEVTHARRVTSGGFEIPIRVVSRNDYMGLPNKSLQAPAVMVYYSRLRDNGVLYVWPTGSAGETTLKITVTRPVQDFDDAGNNPDFPKELVLPFTYTLGVMLAPHFRGAVVPADVKILADELLSSVGEEDEEKTSVFFQPGVR